MSLLLAFALAASTPTATPQGGAGDWSVAAHERRSTRWWSWDRAVNRPVQVAVQFDPVSFEPGGPALATDGRYAPASDGWITLDTFRPLMSGDVDVPAGRYYVVLDRLGERVRVLLLDTDTLHELRLGPADVREAPLARAIEASHVPATSFHQRLEVAIESRVGVAFVLAVRFADHEVTVPFEVALDDAPWTASIAERLNIAGGGSDRVALRAIRRGESSDSHVQLSYNPVIWKQGPRRESRDAAEMIGRSWRLGRNFWTVLTADVPLRFGDAELPAGVWYVGMHASRDGESWQVAFYDPSHVRSELIDSNWISVADPALRVTGEGSTVAEVVDELRIDLIPDDADLRLAIAYGPHRFERRMRPVVDLRPAHPEFWALNWRGGAALRSGRYDAAASIFREIAESNPSHAGTALYNVACAHSCKGDVDAAIVALREAIDHGFTNFAHMRIDPDLDNARDDPRFAALSDG